MVETGTDDLSLSDKDAIAAAECLDFIFQRKQAMEGATELKEIYLPVDDLVFPDGVVATTAGYVDNVLISADETYAELADWKFGMWPVEKADENIQGISYTLGLFKMFPKLQKIRFFFRQPHLELYSDATFFREQIPGLYLRVQVIVARAREAAAKIAKDDWSMAKPMVPACNFCANIGKCAKVMDFALRVGKKFYPLEIPENITPTMVLDRNSTNLAMRLVNVVSTWAQSFRTQTTERVIRGAINPPDGFMLVSQSRRELVDKQKFKEVALKYMDEKAYMDALDVTFGSVESVVSDAAPRGSKKSTVEAFQHELETAGATKRGLPYSFLKAKPQKD